MPQHQQQQEQKRQQNGIIVQDTLELSIETKAFHAVDVSVHCTAYTSTSRSQFEWRNVSKVLLATD